MNSRQEKITELAEAIGVDVKEIFFNLKDPAVIPEDGWVLKYTDGHFTPAMKKIIESTSLEINTSTQPLSKINEVVNIQRTGRYSVTIKMNWSLDATNSDIEVLASFGGQNLTSSAGGRVYKKEGKDAAGNDGDGRGTSQSDSFCQTYYVDINLIGETNILLQFMPEANGVEASIWDASMTIEEIF